MYPNDHVSHTLSLRRDLCYFLYAMYFGYEINLYIYICVYNFTINQCFIIIVIPAMYEVIPFEKGLLYR